MRLFPFLSPATAFATERSSFCDDLGLTDADLELPYGGFNVNVHGSDDPEHVRVCQEVLCRHLGITESQLVMPHQVHGTQIFTVTPKSVTPSELEGVDALITSLRDVCIGVSTADCIPLLFYDPVRQAIGAAHAGWRGTVAGIGASTVQAMHTTFGTMPQDVRCVIGPGIGPEAFEVGDEVYDAFREAHFPMQQLAFRRPSSREEGAERWHIDLFEANRWQLMDAGLQSENIQVSGLCTYTNHRQFFSARRLGIHCGRVFSGIILPPLLPPNLPPNLLSPRHQE